VHKLSHLVAETWSPHSHSAVFQDENSSNESRRLIIGVPEGNSLVFKTLVQTLEPPYFVLYVLHTPRGEGAAGRYQSPEISTEQFEYFTACFGDYFSSDARFDVWVHSPNDKATIVWDRHNLMFAYGPVQRYIAELKTLGFSDGSPETPTPHQHHYRAEFDAQANALLHSLSWSYSPLKPEDEQ
jgi:hypothetical protein